MIEAIFFTLMAGFIPFVLLFVVFAIIYEYVKKERNSVKDATTEKEKSEAKSRLAAGIFGLVVIGLITWGCFALIYGSIAYM